MNDQFVELKNVSLQYVRDASSLALSGLNIQVKKGEFVVVVGPSGCGKSSLMKLVTGLQPVTKGAIQVGDKLVKDSLNCPSRNVKPLLSLSWTKSMLQR
jgi:ABC-type sugar transport system ATPase subunit